MPHNLEEKEWHLLLSRIERGECTPFLGSGASCVPLPLGSEIARRWAANSDYPLNDSEDLAKVAQFLAIEYDAIFPKNKIQSEFIKITKTYFPQLMTHTKNTDSSLINKSVTTDYLGAKVELLIKKIRLIPRYRVRRNV